MASRRHSDLVWLLELIEDLTIFFSDQGNKRERRREDAWETQRNRVQCYSCHEFGHISINCPQKKVQGKHENQPERKKVVRSNDKPRREEKVNEMYYRQLSAAVQEIHTDVEDSLLWFISEFVYKANDKMTNVRRSTVLK